MSRGIYTFFDPPLPTVRFDSAGKAVIEHLAVLEDLAAVRGLVPLGTFMDPRKLAEVEYGALSIHAPVTDAPWEQWFPVEAGSSAVEALLNELWQDDHLQASLYDAPRVLEELEYLAATLRTGKRHSSRFRFEVI